MRNETDYSWLVVGAVGFLINGWIGFFAAILLIAAIGFSLIFLIPLVTHLLFQLFDDLS